MSSSVFQALKDYVIDVYRAGRSVWGSLFTSVPYFFGLGELRKEVTEQYPDPISSRTPDDLPARSRGLLYNDIERCTGCGDCGRVCPAQCIRVEAEVGAEAAKKWVSTFRIDFSRCVFCGLCAEVCQPASLVHTKQYEGAVYKLTDMVANFGRGAVTNEQRSNWEANRNIVENGEVFQ